MLGFFVRGPFKQLQRRLPVGCPPSASLCFKLWGRARLQHLQTERSFRDSPHTLHTPSTPLTHFACPHPATPSSHILQLSICHAHHTLLTPSSCQTLLTHLTTLTTSLTHFTHSPPATFSSHTLQPSSPHSPHTLHTPTSCHTLLTHLTTLNFSIIGRSRCIVQ
jgi:hypothetical protein